MAVKKYALLGVFVLLLACSYFYLINSYNIDTIEYDFVGNLSNAQIKELSLGSKASNETSMIKKKLPFVINYFGRYGDNRLVMTTGMDKLINEIAIINGRWLAYGDAKEAVVGDKAADRLFRSINVLGQTISIYGQQYKITGIAQNNDNIYISFDENSRIQWTKKTIGFIVNDKKYLLLYRDVLEGKLKSMGLGVTDVIIYKHEISIYTNIIIAIAIVIMGRLIKWYMGRGIRAVKVLAMNYREQSRIIELSRYIVNNSRSVISALKSVSLGAIILAAVFKLITLIQLQPSLIPGNLFSPTSYIDTFKSNLEIYFGRLENGISGMQLEIHIINFLLIIYAFAAVIMYNYPSVNKD